MDSIDHKLVDLLAINCRMSLQQLSKKTGVSAHEVNRRIEALLKTGLIRSFKVLLSPLLTNEELSIAILEFDRVPKEKDLLIALEKNQSVWRVHRSLEDKYVIFSVYFDQDELMDLSLTLRKLPGVGHVDLYYHFIRHWGGKIELSDIHKQILRCLAKDARMSIVDIARITGLASKTVIDSINQLRESETVLFTINASDYMKESKIEVLARVQWHVGKTSQEHVSKWLEDSFSSIYLREFVSATEPNLFFNFVVNHVQEVALVKNRSIESGI
ncbi:MAG: AsnC family transcriptional regulator, partial [Candidatus Thorarchaeota archaeon]